MARQNWKEWASEHDKLILLQGWARDGLTMEQIAHNIGIKKTALYEWIKRSTEIANALKKGREVADYEVENALFKSAMGYYVTEEHRVYELNKETGEMELVRKDQDDKYVPPSNTAQIFWLKNRKPKAWLEKLKVQQNNDEVGDSGVIEIAPVLKGGDE